MKIPSVFALLSLLCFPFLFNEIPKEEWDAKKNIEKE